MKRSNLILRCSLRVAMLSKLLVSVVLVGACATNNKIYRETWQPAHIEANGGQTRLVTSALRVADGDLKAVQDAGGILIGYHAARGGWAIRSGSTGGTHFVPVEAAADSARTTCYTWTPGVVTCSSRARAGRWTRVAVLRVPPWNWHLLPPHLIPPTENVAFGIAASAVRDGCSIPNGYGDVSCGGDWAVRQAQVAEPGNAQR